jgi:predicted CoA-binding protein
MPHSETTRRATSPAASPMDWTSNLLTSDAEITYLIDRVRRIAVLGIKPESAAGHPAHEVPRVEQALGFTVIPVPVHYPDVTEILGEPVYRTLASVPPPIDLVQVFRRSANVAAHLEDMLAARPAAVWMQTGVRDDASADVLARAGIRVVQDRCLKVELRARGR